MKVTVIIPNYNGEKYIDDCLISLYKQDFLDFEIIVIDNNSTDRSLEILQNHSSKVKLIKLEENLGFAAACNEGIKNSQGELVALLNNDTVVTPSWLNNLVSCIEDDKRIFSCSSKMLRYYQKDLIDDAGDEYNLLGWSYKRGDGKPKDSYCLRDRKVFSSCAGAAIYRKELLRGLGGFDESFFAYLEDMDLSYRAMIKGYKNLYCSSAEVYHLGSATSGSRYNAFKARLTGRNNILLLYKNMPLLQLILNLPFLFIGFLVKYIFYLRKGIGSSYKDGIYAGLKDIRSTKKVTFSFRDIINYFKIQWLLTKNIFIMAFRR